MGALWQVSPPAARAPAIVRQGVRGIAAQRRLDHVEHAFEFTEHPIMAAALEDIEPAIGQRLGQMIGGSRRHERVVAALPQHGRHVDLLEKETPRGAEQPQILPRPVNAGPQSLFQRRPQIGPHFGSYEHHSVGTRHPLHQGAIGHIRRKAHQVAHRPEEA
jgi:hypothetical protein